MSKRVLTNYQKGLILLIGGTIGFVAAYTFFHYQISKNQSEQAERAAIQHGTYRKKMESLFQSSSAGSSESGSKESGSRSSLSSTLQELKYSQTDANESLAWMNKTGNFPEEVIDLYHSYNEDALVALGDQGDVIALQELADRFFSRDISKASHYYELAAIHGSIFAVRNLAIPGVYQNIKDPYSREAMIDSLALCEVMKIRGETYNGAMQAKSILAVYQRVTEKEFLVDHGLINERAKGIYQNWQAKRSALGLGEFDNTIPEGLRRVYQELEQGK